MSILKSTKVGLLALSKRLGVLSLTVDSHWRSNRLLILCYHGISLEMEHEWRRPLFMTQDEFRNRLQILHRGGYSVLGLDQAVRLLYERRLPERSVAITFDDGNYDFYARAFPVLKEYGYPVTVYLTTYHVDHPVPVFHLICSYIFWKRRGSVVAADQVLGRGTILDLRTSAGRRNAVAAVVEYADRNDLGVNERDELAKAVSTLVGEDAERLWEKRILQLMNADEVSELARAGVRFELHTHRHRSPRKERLYRREIRDNRRSIIEKTGSEPRHFCYPSGVYRDEFLPWLQAEEVVSATTCRPALATPGTDPLLLPRLVDHGELSNLEFEGWLAGVSDFIPQRRRASRSPG